MNDFEVSRGFSNMYEVKYCAFIDLLGNKNLVMDEDTSIEEKIKTLHSIYFSLATQFSMTINQLNHSYADQI